MGELKTCLDFQLFSMAGLKRRRGAAFKHAYARSAAGRGFRQCCPIRSLLFFTSAYAMHHAAGRGRPIPEALERPLRGNSFDRIKNSESAVTSNICWQQFQKRKRDIYVPRVATTPPYIKTEQCVSPIGAVTLRLTRVI